MLTNHKTILAHIYIAIALLVVDTSPLNLLVLSPILIYGYTAFACDVKEHGFCLAVFVGPEEDEPIMDHLAQELHEDTGRDVKVICYRRTEDGEDLLDQIMDSVGREHATEDDEE
jgi:hypothetical protein